MRTILAENPTTVQDKEIAKRLRELSQSVEANTRRIEEVANVRSGSAVGSPFDVKLDKIVDQVGGIDKRLSGLEGKVEHHIWFAKVLFGALYALAATGIVLAISFSNTIGKIESANPSLSLQILNKGELDKNKLEKIQSVVEAATKTGTPILPSLVKDLGTKTIVEAKQNPALSAPAWSAASALIGYRTQLNESAVPSIGPNPEKIEGSERDLQIPQYNWFTHIPAVPVGSSPRRMVLASTEGVPVGDAARYESLGDRHNANSLTGPKQIIVDGLNQVDLLLDGLWLKNVVIRNAIVIYRGGPLILENVVFVNCNFDFQQTHPAAVDLAAKILDNSTIDFESFAKS